MVRSCNHRSSHRQRAGFTLVELLVVIGIIALLISILLPSLNRAREEGKRTVCLSGLRSFGQMLNMYASQNNGRAPLGYASTKHAGYMVWQNGSFQVLGTLYESGFMKQGVEAYYCPSKLDTRWMYNTGDNPWPPPPPSSTQLVRLGMTVRPQVRFGKTVGGVTLWMVPDSNNLDAQQWRGAFPQLTKMKDKAIAAEMFGEPFNTGAGGPAVDPTVTSHKNLINVMYADQSAGAVDIRAVDPADNKSILDLLKQLKALAAVPSGQTMNDIYLDEINVPNRGMWHKMDIQK